MGQDAAAADAADGSICPISQETGVAPRRQSLDVRPGSASSLGAAAGAGGPSVLTADGRLSLHSMSMREPQLVRSSSLSSSGSFMRRQASRSASFKQAPSSNPWHVSAAWEAPAEEVATTAASQLPPDVQALAVACAGRNVKALQQLLARRVSTAHALDAAGNTALHLLLLPPHDAACRAFADQPHHAQVVSGTTTSSSTPRGGGGALPSWLTGCFGGGSRAAVHDDDAGGGSSHSNGSSSGRLPPAAAAAAQLTMVTALLRACADANVRNVAGQTPLMLAAQQVMAVSGQSSAQASCALKVLEALSNNDMTDPNMKDAQGRTALALLMLPACSASTPPSGTAATATQQQQRKQQAAACSGSTPSGGSGVLQRSPSMQQRRSQVGAVAATQLKATQLLLRAGAEPNVADTAGMTPLMHAAAQPGVTRELLQLLLERGGNPRQLDSCRRSALTHAVVAQNLQPVPALGLDPTRLRHDFCAVCGRCSPRNPGLIKVAADQAADTDTDSSMLLPPPPPGGAGALGRGSGEDVSNRSSSAASSSACAHCGGAAAGSSSSISGALSLPSPTHSSVIRVLCGFGALDLFPGSINTRYPGVHGFTQLHIAVRRGDLTAVQMLLAGGADMNACDVWGNTPLFYWPVLLGEPDDLAQEMVARLLTHGADPNLPNQDGWLPLDLACDLSKFDKVEVKLQCVPVHAILVGWGAKNSAAFKAQNRNAPQLACLGRTDSANSFIQGTKALDSLRADSRPLGRGSAASSRAA